MEKMEEMWGYVAANAGADTLKLMLKSEPDLPFDKRFAVMQIECRKKAKNKIPELLANERFLFPKAISAEQCTHQQVAQFHASLFQPTDSVLDMTMGLGVDSYYISQRVASLKAIELDEEIAAAGAHNYAFTVVNSDSVAWLTQTDERFDAVFIDPARRGDGGARLYGLADCAPDVLGILPTIKAHTKRLYIKASPMIDVTQSMRDLAPHLTDMWAVSVKNECKELFFEVDFGVECADVQLHALNFEAGGAQEFAVDSAALTRQFPILQIAKNSHLYYSDDFVEDFPGRKFVIDSIIPFSGKEAKTVGKQHKQLNIATRNFRLSPDELKKRLKVRDGGDCYLFATTLANGEQVLLLTRKA